MEEFMPQKLIQNFEEITKNAEMVQTETLKKILEENGEIEYLKKHGLNRKTDVESFKSCIPLVTRKDLEPYIQRIVDGDASPILTAKPITKTSFSSGTTEGKPKFVPFTQELLDIFMRMYATSFAFRNREFPIDDGKVLTFVYGYKYFKTRGGLTVGSVTSHVYPTPEYKTAMKAMKCHSCSPPEVLNGTDFNQLSLYCHLLSALIFCDEIQYISALFAYNIIHPFRNFEKVWEELCTDIRDGVLTSRITIPSIRTAMSKLLHKPNPELAELIHKKCLELLPSDWYGLIPTLFPNAKYVTCIMTGSMEAYVKKLRHYAGDLHLLNGDYGGTEGWIGVNIHPKLPPECGTFAVVPNNAYFEFKPLIRPENFEDSNQILGLTEVKVGEEYEIIVTNFTGMYRYFLGDVVKVTSFHNNTPEVQFVRRSNVVLNINIDRTTEKDIQLVVEAAAAKLLSEENLEVVDYTSHADLSKEPGLYVIIWEINGEASNTTLAEYCNLLDKSFCTDLGYMDSRKANTLGPLELRIVKTGTFLKILEYYISLGTSADQFKASKCVAPTNKNVLQILTDNVVKTYASTAYNASTSV